MYKFWRIVGVSVLVIIGVAFAIYSNIEIVPDKSKIKEREEPNPRDFTGLDTLVYGDSLYIMRNELDTVFKKP